LNSWIRFQNDAIEADCGLHRNDSLPMPGQGQGHPRPVFTVRHGGTRLQQPITRCLNLANLSFKEHQKQIATHQ